MTDLTPGPAPVAPGLLTSLARAGAQKLVAILIGVFVARTGVSLAAGQQDLLMNAGVSLALFSVSAGWTWLQENAAIARFGAALAAPPPAAPQA
jgi:high-affinity Fe2+/Pb2+ permease